MLPRVLIVDDALFMRRMLRRLLETMGCEIVGEAADGVEALEQFKKLKPDLITLDIVMPNLDGIETVKQLRALDKDVKIVMVSALDQRQALLEAVRQGADDYVVKPFDPGNIEAAINRALKALA